MSSLHMRNVCYDMYLNSTLSKYLLFIYIFSLFDIRSINIEFSVQELCTWVCSGVWFIGWVQGVGLECRFRGGGV